MSANENLTIHPQTQSLKLLEELGQGRLYEASRLDNGDVIAVFTSSDRPPYRVNRDGRVSIAEGTYGWKPGMNPVLYQLHVSAFPGPQETEPFAIYDVDVDPDGGTASSTGTLGWLLEERERAIREGGSEEYPSNPVLGTTDEEPWTFRPYRREPSYHGQA